MAKTLRNIIVTAAILGASLLPQKADAQTQVRSAGGGIDTVYAVTADKQDSAKILYWSRDGTTGLGAVEVNNVLYIAENPSAHHDSSTTFNTRKVPGKNYGYTIRVDEIIDGGITVANMGRTNSPAPEPVGKEYLFKQKGETQTINGKQVTFAGASTYLTGIQKSQSGFSIGNTPCNLPFNEWITVEGDKYMNTFAFADGKPNGFSLARIATEEPSTIIQRKNTPYVINQTRTDGNIFDVSGRKIYSGPNVIDIAKKVMSQNPSGAYIVRMPNGNASLERKIK